MGFDFAGQCCDAHDYLRIGVQCAAELKSCWDPARPIGAGLYFSVPLRLGMRESGAILLHFAVIGFGVWFARRAARALAPAERRALYGLLAGPFVLTAYLSFLFHCAWYSLTDLPSAVTLATAVWLFIDAERRGSVFWSLVAGFMLGATVLLRIFYYYPTLMCAGSFVLLSYWKRRRLARSLTFLSGVLLAMAPQYVATHSITGEWTFVSSQFQAQTKNLHLDTKAYGYETLAWGKGFFYQSDCFKNSTSVLDAYQKYEWSELGCVLLQRQYFYFAGEIDGGYVYLDATTDREFSWVYAALHLVALGLAIKFICSRNIPRSARLPILVLMLACWGQASAIIPELRFLMGFNVIVWSFAALELCKSFTSVFGPLVDRITPIEWGLRRIETAPGRRVPEGELELRLKQSNPKGQLLELCTRRRLEAPILVESVDNGYFTAEYRLAVNGTQASSGPQKAGSKRIAQQLAASALLQDLRVKLVDQRAVKVPRRNLELLRRDNPKGRLLELCTRHGLDTPLFQSNVAWDGFQIRISMQVRTKLGGTRRIESRLWQAEKARDAEKAAATEVLQAIEDLDLSGDIVTVSPVAPVPGPMVQDGPPAERPSDGPVKLNELKQAKVIEDYGFELEEQRGTTHSPVLVMRGWATAKGGVREAGGACEGPTKKAARIAAADSLLLRLNEVGWLTPDA